jgi:hypothetical protein
LKFELIRACKMCPFANTPDRITFRGIERATEIEESAYRNGFPCHEHAEWLEANEETGFTGGAYAREDDSSQHCFGALAMWLHEGDGNIPWEHAIEEDEELVTRWWDRVAFKDYEQCFDGPEEFIKANTET